MCGHSYEQFFLKPGDPVQRRYETLRAVFVDKQPMKEVAQRFDVHYGTVRNWASEFRAHQNERQSSPFFSRPDVADQRTVRKKKFRSSTPMCKHCL